MSRVEFDYYPTPRWMTDLLLDRLELWAPALDRPLRILEPCAGQGNIVHAICDRYPGSDVYSNDLDPRHDTFSHEDATRPEFWGRFGTVPPHWIITNPPFSAAMDILRHALEFAEVGVAMLLRLSFAEPTEDRGQWLAAHPITRLYVLPRYSFRQNGSTDSVTSAWFVWSRMDTPAIEVIPGRAPQAVLL